MGYGAIFAVIIISVTLLLFLLMTFKTQSPQTYSGSPNGYRQAHYKTRHPMMCPEGEVSGDYVVVDIETTGLKPEINEIIEIGAVKYFDHHEVEAFHTYVRPDSGVNPDAYAINHISWESVKNAPSIFEASEDFMNFISDFTIVGYNIKFDIEFLQTRMMSYIANSAIDVIPFARHWIPGLFDYKLDTVKRAIGVDSVSHTAIEDCHATAAVYQHCLRLRKTVMSEKPEQEHKQTAQSEAAETETMKNYFDVVEAIVKQSFPDAILTPAYYTGEQMNIFSSKSYSRFFFVKAGGRLKYWLSPSSISEIEKINCGRYKLSQGSKSEGVDFTRVFVTSPSDLYELREIILVDYQSLVPIT